jgi:hypothetical protein
MGKILLLKTHGRKRKNEREKNYIRFLLNPGNPEGKQKYFEFK